MKTEFDLFFTDGKLDCLEVGVTFCPNNSLHPEYTKYLSISLLLVGVIIRWGRKNKLNFFHYEFVRHK